MSVEFGHLSPIEKELRFVKLTREREIKRILTDLDDTICPTRRVFKYVHSQVFDLLDFNYPNLSRDEWKNEVHTINDELFEKHGVSRERWNLVADVLAKRHNLDSALTLNIKSLYQSIYETPLEMFPGAEQFFVFMKKIDFPVGVVTHAGREWTWRKYHFLGLDKYISWDDIFIVNENGHKTWKSWKESTDFFRVLPHECIMAGDSPRTDINPAREIGIKYCFLLEDPNQWTVHQQEVDSSVLRINHLGQLVEVLLENN